MGKVICLINQKGGVGKTSIAFNLAKLLSQNHRVLAIDNDHQGNLTSSFLNDTQPLQADILSLYKEQPITPQEVDGNLHVMGATLDLAGATELGVDVIYRLKEGLAGVKDRYDYIIIDCHPDFGYLALAALTASDYVLIPTKAAPYALGGLKSLLDVVDKAQRRLNPDLKILGIVLNLMEKTTIAQSIEAGLRETYGAMIFKTVISKAVKIEESPAVQQGIHEYEPASKPAEQFRQLADEFKAKIEEGRA